MSSALERPDPIPLPVTQNSRNQTTLISEERRLPDVAERKAMTNIKNGVPTIKAGLSLVRRKPLARRGAVHGRTDALPGGITIDGMAVSIVRAELEPMAQLLSKRKLKAVTRNRLKPLNFKKGDLEIRAAAPEPILASRKYSEGFQNNWF